MSEDEPDVAEDWELAREHGQAIGDYISEQDGYIHPSEPGRNSDGTFRKRYERHSGD